MRIVERKVVPGQHHKRCESAGCNKSGRYTANFLGGYATPLCSEHRIVWAQAWHDAKTNWADEFREAA